MSVCALHHAAIPYPIGLDAQARAFYVDLLGLLEIEKPNGLKSNGGLWFSVPDGRQLHLQGEPQFRPLTHPHPAFACRELDRLGYALEADGRTVRWDERWDGVRRFFTHDPFGNRIEIVDAGAVGL